MNSASRDVRADVRTAVWKAAEPMRVTTGNVHLNSVFYYESVACQRTNESSTEKSSKNTQTFYSETRRPLKYLI